MKYRGTYHHPDNAARLIEIKLNGLSPEQQRIQRLQDCYHGRLFDDPKRDQPWGRLFDSSGRDIDKERWKPIFIPSIGKEIVHRHIDALFGGDSFPDIVPVTETEIFSPQDLVMAAAQEITGLDTEQAERQRRTMINEKLAEFTKAILFDQADLMVKAAEIAAQAIVCEKAPVSIKFINGRACIESHDVKWSDWEFSPDDPTMIAWFREQYCYEAFSPDTGKVRHYWYRYEIDQEAAYEWVIEVGKKDKDKIPQWGAPQNIYPHNLGFCPLVIWEMPGCQSIFSDEIVNNIEGFIAFYNDVLTGLNANMNPQFALLRKEDPDIPTLNSPPGTRKEPLKKGAVWQLTGDQLVKFASDTEGYISGMEQAGKMESNIKRAARIIDVPESTELSGEALRVLLKPMHSATMAFRTALGEGGLLPLAKMLLKAAIILRAHLALPPNIAIPILPDFDLKLDWGSLLPVTEQNKIQSLDIAERMKTLGFSEYSSLRYVASLVGVEDIEADQRRKEEEQERSLVLYGNSPQYPPTEESNITDEREDEENVD